MKKRFFHGWKFSTDGQTYEDVGLNATYLRETMYYCDECLRELDSYKKNTIVNSVTGGISYGALMLPFVLLVVKSEWEPVNTYLAGIGVVSFVVSITSSRLAGNNLQRAVDLHNSSDYASADRIRMESLISFHDKSLVVGVSLRF